MFDNLLDIANCDISDLIDEHGQVKTEKLKDLNTYPIQGYDRTVTETKDGVNVKTSIKMVDKLKAVTEITKMLGMVAPERIEVKQTIEVVPMALPKVKKDKKDKD
jgi:hypothetical protein